MDFLEVALFSVSALMCVEACRRRTVAFEGPVILAVMTAVWILPQAVATRNSGRLPAPIYYTSILYAIGVLVCVWLGARLAREAVGGSKFRSFQFAIRAGTTRRSRAVMIAGVGGVVSWYGAQSTTTLNEYLGGGMFSIWWWLLDLLWVGAALSLDSPPWSKAEGEGWNSRIPKLLFILLMLRLATIGLRREWAVRIGLLGIARAIRVGRIGNFATRLAALVASAAVLGFLTAGTAEIRSALGSDGKKALELELIREGASQQISDGYEFANYCAIVEHWDSGGGLALGRYAWNVIANRTIPAVLVGYSVKRSLFFDLPRWSSSWQGPRHPGTSETLFGSLLYEFGLGGLIVALALGFFYESVILTSLRGDGFWMLLFSSTLWIGASHGIQWVAASLIIALILLMVVRLLSGLRAEAK